MPATDAAASSSGGRASKSQKRSKIVTLKLSSTLLAKFPGIPADELKSEDKSKASSPSSNTSAAAAGPPVAASPDNASDSASTPAVNGGGSTPAPAAETIKRRGVSGPKPGRKRGLGDGVDAAPKPRGKPGPKKKPRLEDGTIDTSARPAGPVASHKLGPKANQGAINAGLRALDRTGKPCRKWERKSFNLKSFTGVVWQVPTWSAPPKPKLSENGTPADSDSKANNSASAVESEKSNSGEADTTPLPTNVESSPAPVVAAVS